RKRRPAREVLFHRSERHAFNHVLSHPSRFASVFAVLCRCASLGISRAPPAVL
ncbi:hypothetical protein H4R99_008112, partial [Coemansia sp. RSA 1722]